MAFAMQDSEPQPPPLLCAVCDAAHAGDAVAPGSVARCRRCGAVMQDRRGAAVGAQIVGAVAMLALTALALTAPFLTLSEAGLRRTVSLLDAAEALDADFAPLGALLALVVVGVPALRAGAHLYALAPVLAAGRAAPGAARALRLAQTLRPWAMAEIFVIGVAVSTIKVAALAMIEPGPALFALGGAALVGGFEAALIARESVWTAVADAHGAG
jgi:paraquat-inducible protein A